MRNTELGHSGIKGMRWGHRRFQNKDGSLTPEGKKRYGEAPKNDTDDTSEDYKKARAKSVSQMTDKELQEAVTRLQREKLYSDLNKPKISKGREYFNKLSGRLADKAVEVTANKIGEKVFNKIADVAIDASSRKVKSTIGQTAKGRDFLRKYGLLNKKK